MDSGQTLEESYDRRKFQTDMRSLRRSCVVIIAFGGFLLATPRDSSFATIPFPGAGVGLFFFARACLDWSEPSLGETKRWKLGPEEVTPCGIAGVRSRNATYSKSCAAPPPHQRPLAKPHF